MTTYQTNHYDLRAPNNDELVRNGAQAIRNLADDVDAALYAGLSGLPSETVKTLYGSTVGDPNGYGAMSVVFPSFPFTQAPIVVVSNGDVAAFWGHIDLSARSIYGFTVLCYTASSYIQTYVRAYAEWAVNHGETAASPPVATRMKTGQTGQPSFTQVPGGQVRVNWIAVGT